MELTLVLLQWLGTINLAYRVATTQNVLLRELNCFILSVASLLKHQICQKIKINI